MILKFGKYFLPCIFLIFSCNISHAIKPFEKQSVRRPMRDFIAKSRNDDYIRYQQKEYERNAEKLRQNPPKALADEDDDENGMDLALRRQAAEFEMLWLELMWTFADRTDPNENSFAHNHYQQELTKSIVNNGHELGEIGEGIYEDGKRIQKNKKKKKRKRRKAKK